MTSAHILHLLAESFVGGMSQQGACVQVQLGSRGLPDMAINIDLPNGTYLFDATVQQHVDCVQKHLVRVLELHGSQCFQQVDLDGAKQTLAKPDLLQLFQCFAESGALILKVSAIYNHTSSFQV